jgi:hypothetical protein
LLESVKLPGWLIGLPALASGVAEALLIEGVDTRGEMGSHIDNPDPIASSSEATLTVATRPSALAIAVRGEMLPTRSDGKQARVSTQRG